MAKEILKPIIHAYSASLLSFIRFLRDRLPMVPGEGMWATEDQLDEELPK